MISAYNSSKVFWAFLLAILLLAGPLWAHNPKETYGNWQIQRGKAHLLLEVPWTFADAVKKEFPDRGEGDLFPWVERYIRRHLQVWQEGEQMEAVAIRDISSEMGHSARLEILYPFSELEDLSIKSRLLFNLEGKPRNLYRFNFANGETREFVSSPAQDSFTTPAGANGILPIIGLVLLGALPLVFYALWRWVRS